MSTPSLLRVGLVGTGYMGLCHAIAFHNAPAVFGTVPVQLRTVCDPNLATAQQAQRRFGFAQASDDWQAMVRDPEIDIVAIATPNYLHKPMALAAIEAGKHVYCEKPLALTAEDAREMADAATRAGLCTLAGYNYLRSPAIALIKKLLDEGALGAPTHFRGVFDEDYMAGSDVPYSWRCQQRFAGSGALGDMGSHLISAAMYLLGPIQAVCADTLTVIPERPMPAGGAGREERGAGAPTLDPSGAMGAVENEDVVQVLVRFASGAIGTLASSRIAWGRKNQFAFTLYGRNGGVEFDQERFNEVKVYRIGDLGRDRDGFRTVLTGPEHPPYERFSPAPGHGLGFNDLKTSEVAHFIDGIVNGTALYPDFAAAAEVERVVDAMLLSARERRWVEL